MYFPQPSPPTFLEKLIFWLVVGTMTLMFLNGLGWIIYYIYWLFTHVKIVVV